MKNLQYFPFERNRYYYGKLLTEQDFNSEQRYFNDKRRMSNRFLHGTGVAAGLSVIGIDGKSVSLEPGFALDGAGREIVVDRPQVVKLEQLDGFSAMTEKEQLDFVYLCIEYGEKEAVPSYQVASNASVQTENVEYDKWREGYHLYLTDRPAKDGMDTLETLFTRRMTVYEDSGICILQEIPRFVKSGEEFVLRLRVENRGSVKECRLKLKMALACASFQGEKLLSVDETIRFESRDSVKEFAFVLKAFPVELGEVELSVKPEEFQLSWGQKSCRLLEESACRIPVVTKDIPDVLEGQHFKETMNRILQNPYPDGIYLAKIYLIQTGHVYRIDKLEAMPFGQYVYHPLLLRGLLGTLLSQKQEEKNEAQTTAPVSQMKGERQTENRAEGLVEIELGVGGKRGQRFFSHEIVHGLGLGRVVISLSLVKDQEMLSGSSEVFEDFVPKAELAAKADVSRGSFVIGLRLLEATGQQTVTVHWSAVLVSEKDKGALAAREIRIRPDKLELKVRESHYLEAVTKNLSGSTILWEVKSKDGGTISRDGMYMAPNRAGVYEIQAWCQEMPAVRASLYVIVRE